MPSQLRIDQVSLSAGVAGRSRTDGLATGAQVTLTNTGTGTTTRFQFLWVPPDDSAAVPSLVATGNSKIWTFNPSAGVFGSYLIELIEDQGLPTEKKERRVFGIRTPTAGLLIPAANERANPAASLINAGLAMIEAADNNAQDYGEAALNTVPWAAWWRSLAELIKVVEAGGGGGGGSSSVSAESLGFDPNSGDETLQLLGAAHTPGLYMVGAYGRVVTAPATGEVVAKINFSDGTSQELALLTNDLTSTGAMQWLGALVYSDGADPLSVTFEHSAAAAGGSVNYHAWAIA